MKKKLFKRILTICMCATMLVETVNVSTLTVRASEESTAVSAITQDSNLKETVENGEAADKAAYDAAQAAQDAAAVAEDAKNAAVNLGKTAADAVLTSPAPEATEGPSVAPEATPALKEEIEKEISEAETAVADSNQKVEEASKNLENIATEAENKTAEEATKAQNAATKAQEAAKQAEALKAQIENAERADANLEDVLDATKKAAEDAQAAADQAKQAYDKAQATLDTAQEAYDKAKTQAEADIKAGIENADKELEEAKKALAAAEAEVGKAEAAYKTATGSNEIAQKTAEAAKKAADQAGIAAGKSDEAAAAAKVVDEKKKAKEDDNIQLEQQKSEIQGQQDTLRSEIADKEAQIAAKEAEIEAVEKAIDDLGRRRYLVWSDEYKKAQELKDQINNLENDIDTLKGDINTAKDTISLKDTEIAAKDAQIAENNTYIAGIVASQKVVEDLVADNNTQITYLDKEKQDEFNTLLDELKESTQKYEDAKELREEYQDAIDRSNVGLIEWFRKVHKELSIEAKNDNAKIEMDWEHLELKYTNDGLTLLLGKNKNNEQVLLTWENNKLTATLVDEHEFAAYSTAFDKVAAAQAATKAADAATAAAKAEQAEKEALDQYNAAKEALEAAKKRLEAARNAKLNDLQLDAARKALETAKKNVADAKEAYEDAQSAAVEAKKDYEDAQKDFAEKPVTAYFYILNRGLTQPSEVSSYPSSNYSKARPGQLKKGENNSYLDQYARGRGIKDTDLTPYIEKAPTAADFGLTLKEGEYIKWYVIKTESDNSIHVDGIIMNQKFNVTVHYLYEDETGNTVKVAEDFVGTYGLGEEYHIATPGAVIDGFQFTAKNATDAEISGTATADREVTVWYNKEEGVPVTVNYYRESVNGILLHSEIRNIGKSQAADYPTTLTEGSLNAWRPGDCENGVLVSYEKTEDGYVANIVYSPIIVTPIEPGTTGGEGGGEPGEDGTTTGTVTAPEAAAPAGNTTVATVQQVAGARQQPVAQTVIEEETTPLAPAATEEPEQGITATTNNNVVSIEDEAAPLAASANCWIHWLILLLTVVYTAYELIRCINRNKKINELRGEARQTEV
ncbi:MAG: hypothetical protein MR442_09430 [Lachnospiraceae bacterium]|nr:hypothetical protein [Lachnospiraceae bacterium]